MLFRGKRGLEIIVLINTSHHFVTINFFFLVSVIHDVEKKFIHNLLSTVESVFDENKIVGRSECNIHMANIKLAEALNTN